MEEYRGFVSFSAVDERFRRKVDNYYKWCEGMGYDPNNDDNWNSFSEFFNS